MNHRAVIGVGSNLEPDRHVAAARLALASEQELLAESAWVRTAALGAPDATGQPTLRPDQPDYLNGVFLIATALDQPALRAYLRALETRLGRRRSDDRWAARTIDLDLVVFDGVIVDPDVATRDFLATAVAAVWPGLEALGSFHAGVVE